MQLFNLTNIIGKLNFNLFNDIFNLTNYYNELNDKL